MSVHRAKPSSIARIPHPPLRGTFPPGEGILEDIAINGEYNDARIEAISKIKNQDLLVDLAYNDEDSKIRESACKNIQNVSVLDDIAINDKDKYVREVAKKRSSLLKK